MTYKEEIKADFLSNRIQQNERNQTLDLNAWIFSLIQNKDKYTNILELCCGTGNQTKFLSEFPKAKSISCVDASIEALDILKTRDFYDSNQISLVEDGIDQFLLREFDEKFDLIFCSYGLYYSNDIDTLLDSIYENLSPGGSFIVVGPYGLNNNQLFEILNKSKVKYDDFVHYSSSRFMFEDVLKFNVAKFSDIKINTAINPVRWKEKESILKYWENSTFYDKTRAAEVNAMLDDHFKHADEFINDKHIMTIQAQKK